MSTLNVNNILNETGTGLPDNLISRTLVAWVKFDGDGTILDSFNVTSVVNLLNVYTINLSGTIIGAQYAVECTAFGSDDRFATVSQTLASSIEVKVWDATTNTNIESAASVTIYSNVEIS